MQIFRRNRRCRLKSTVFPRFPVPARPLLSLVGARGGVIMTSCKISLLVALVSVTAFPTISRAAVPFSGCRGDSSFMRCCTRDFVPGHASGNFELMPTQTDFGSQCSSRGGYLYLSSEPCTLRTASHGRLRNQAQIRCELPAAGVGPGQPPIAPPITPPITPPSVDPGTSGNGTETVPIPSAARADFPGPIAGLIGSSYLDITVSVSPFYGAGTYLEYGFMGRGPNTWTIGNLRSAARLGTVMQFGFEPYADMTTDEVSSLESNGLLPEEFALHRASANSVEFTLAQIRDAIRGRGSLDTINGSPRDNARNNLLNRFYDGLTSWADVLHNFGQTVLLRPMSEMNDATARWQLSSAQSKALESRAGEVGARAQLYAEIWGMIYDVFQARGASNVKFLFIPLVHQGNRTDRSAEGTRAALEALRRIDPAKVDALGLNVYTTQYATSTQVQTNSFASLTQEWLQWLRNVPGYSSKPLTVGEMGVGQLNRSTGGENPESNRIKWIREAFSSARSQGFSMATYFDADNSACVTDECTQALAQAIKSFQER